jgi:hypothetical protein
MNGRQAKGLRRTALLIGFARNKGEALNPRARYTETNYAEHAIKQPVTRVDGTTEEVVVGMYSTHTAVLTPDCERFWIRLMKKQRKRNNGSIFGGHRNRQPA